MRNRLNVYYQGNRTTARFPSYLWRLALAASGLQEPELAQRVKDYAGSIKKPNTTASQAVQGYLVNIVELELFAIGFNADNSRAPVTGNAPKAPAAEARHRSGVS